MTLLASKIGAEASFHPSTAPEFIMTAGFYNPGDGGRALYAPNGTSSGDMTIELADGVTEVGFDVAEPVLNSKMFGAKWDGTTDDTAAIQRVMNDTRPVMEPVGTAKVETIYVPDGQGKIFLGSGWGTIFKATGATIFRKSTDGGVMQGGTFGDFAVHPGNTQVDESAIRLSGFRHSEWRHVKGIDSGEFGFRSLFNLAAYPYLCYSCKIDRPELDNKNGYLFGIEFDNGGTDNALYNANATQINLPWFVGCRDLVRGIDARRSTATTILTSLVEGNPQAVALDVGQTTLALGGWHEVNAYGMRFAKGNDGGAGVNSLIVGMYGNPDPILFEGDPHGNMFLWCGGIDDGVWSGNTPGANVKVKPVQTLVGQPTMPAINYVSGEGSGAVLTMAQAYVRKPFDQLTRRYAVSMYYTFAPGTAASETQFSVDVPAGYTLMELTVGAMTSSGIPCASAVNSAADGFWIANKSTNERISVYAEYRLA